MKFSFPFQTWWIIWLLDLHLLSIIYVFLTTKIASITPCRVEGFFREKPEVILLNCLGKKQYNTPGLPIIDSRDWQAVLKWGALRKLCYELRITSE